MTERTFEFINAENWLKHNTHGHVIPHVNGHRARCGGRKLCEVCMCEAQLKMLIDDCRRCLEVQNLQIYPKENQ